MLGSEIGGVLEAELQLQSVLILILILGLVLVLVGVLLVVHGVGEEKSLFRS